MAPVAPVAPVLPVEPVLPVAPVAPVAPVLPVAPVAPVAPVLPVAPVAPCSPVSPLIFVQAYLVGSVLSVDTKSVYCPMYVLLALSEILNPSLPSALVAYAMWR